MLDGGFGNIGVSDCNSDDENLSILIHCGCYRYGPSV
jgi:hypothetical protein